jgi:hypothetical protein
MKKKPEEPDKVVTPDELFQRMRETIRANPRIKLKDLKKKNTALGKKKPPSEKE